MDPHGQKIEAPKGESYKASIEMALAFKRGGNSPLSGRRREVAAVEQMRVRHLRQQMPDIPSRITPGK